MEIPDCSKSGKSGLTLVQGGPIGSSTSQLPYQNTQEQRPSASNDRGPSQAKLPYTHKRYPSRPSLEGVLDLSTGVGGRVRRCDPGFG
jgi:hypothetical protein